MNLDNLNQQELKNLLKNLSLYKKLTSQIWNRGREIFSQIKEWKNKFVVEFFPNIEKKFVLDEAKKVYEDVFNQKKINDEEIFLIENEKILWWMKIFFNDDVVDMSFLKIQNLIKK